VSYVKIEKGHARTGDHMTVIVYAYIFILRKESSERVKTREICQTLWLRECTLIERRNINQNYDYAEADSKSSCTDQEGESDCTYMKFILQSAQKV
jgi:hypothetical protein